MSTKRLGTILQEIEKIKTELHDLDVFRPGSLTKQYRNPKEKTGEFYSLSYTHRMKSKTEYVREGFAKDIRSQIRSYKRFKKRIERWIALGIEYSQLSMKLKIQEPDSSSNV